MLLAITISEGHLYVTTENGEFRDLDLPDGVLTASELEQVRAVRPDALPGYPVYQPKVESDEQDQR